MTAEQKELATLLHFVFCNGTHTMEMTELKNPEYCSWYLEEQIAECWELPCHTYETGKLEGFLERLGVEKPEEALKIMKDYLSALRALNNAIDGREFLVRITKRLLTEGFSPNLESLLLNQESPQTLRDVLPASTSQ